MHPERSGDLRLGPAVPESDLDHDASFAGQTPLLVDPVSLLDLTLDPLQGAFASMFRGAWDTT